MPIEMAWRYLQIIDRLRNIFHFDGMSSVLRILVTVFSIALISALNVPPQRRSSHVPVCGNRSATRAQPINSQSLMHAFGEPWPPLPTIELTTMFEFPDKVNDLDRLKSSEIGNIWIIRSRITRTQLNSKIFTWILAGSVLNTAKIPFSSHADAVVLIGQLAAHGRIKIETSHTPIHSCVVLQTACIGSGQTIAWNLTDANAPLTRKRCPTGDYGQHNWIALTQSSINVHWLG